MGTIKNLVLDKQGEPMGVREITVTRDLMCFTQGNYLYLVKPVDKNLRKEKTMTLEKAIEIQECAIHGVEMPDDPDLVPAMKLGIEALEEILLIRQAISTGAWRKLPGETKE